jgi:hypothetical protein
LRGRLAGQGKHEVNIDIVEPGRPHQLQCLDGLRGAGCSTASSCPRVRTTTRTLPARLLDTRRCLPP